MGLQAKKKRCFLPLAAGFFYALPFVCLLEVRAHEFLVIRLSRFTIKLTLYLKYFFFLLSADSVLTENFAPTLFLFKNNEDE